jgi:hypothetical protein
VDVSKVSCYKDEDEVLLIPPVSLIIRKVEHETGEPGSNGTIKIYLETIENSFCYLKDIVA